MDRQPGRAPISVLLLACALAAGAAAPARTQSRDLARDPSSGLAGGRPSLDPGHFPVPASLVPNIEFWRAIFSEHTSSRTILHDDRHLDIVYGVVDVADLERAGAPAAAIERARHDRTGDAIRAYQEVLRRLAGDRHAGADTAEMARVRALFARAAGAPDDFGAAVNRVRGQGGLRDQFADAIAVSGLFMPGIERILARRGVPVEIARLPFVESMFNYRARSSAGASGIWQFTRDTGRQYLQIDAVVDARSDVWLAAEAAAAMLADHYARVGSWPVALTGYNHGIAGMARAVRQLGTRDIGVIAARYRSPTFGFASRNFYAEFVAAATVYADRARHFPRVDPLPPLRFDELTPGHFVSMLDLAQLTGTGMVDLVTLNPALHDEVGRGRLLVPAAYPLRVPAGRLAAFEAALARLPASRKRDRQLTVTHRVARGDTLGALARRFDTSVAALRRANGLRSTRIAIGQLLEIPGQTGGWEPLVWTPEADAVAARGDAATSQHRVRPGQTLTQIAQRYGTSVALLMRANDLASSLIRVGQLLDIPSPR
jgi:membrane-bound lytic murein transglycosylase D